MYVLQNWTFTPGAEGAGEIEIPGVYTIEQFALITNITRNIPLFDPEEHEATITVADNGVATTVTLYQNTSFCQPSDELQIVMYDLYSGGGSGPSSDVAVTNWPASQNINGAVSVTGEVEVKNDTGNPLPVSGTVTANQGTSPWVVSGNLTTTSAVSGFPVTATDAFGRLRVSNPVTLFDSSHRYSDNGKWATLTANGGTAIFNANQGLVDLNVTTAAGSQVSRETLRVFSYQPGKSLLVENTFVMASPQAGLTQRVGYYDNENGYYIELGATLASLGFVERSKVTGSIVNTKVLQQDWNVDTMDGNGPSGITLDITKSQILWMDMEWLGAGTVAMGFVINRQYHLCHLWNHANSLASTYIATACLPERYEIFNTGATVSPKTLKQICSTVISEGGYSLAGTQRSAGTAITTPKELASAGVYYPVASLRLKSTALNAIAILSGVSLMGTGNNETFRWQLMAGSAVAGGTWTTADPDSVVDYNLTGTGVTGGTILASGYFNSSNQGSPTIDLPKEDLFSYQLERDPYTGTPVTLTLAVAGANNATSVLGSVNWQEVTR
jgi:hypothetical protein